MWQHPRRPGLRGSPETLDGGHSEAMPCHLGRRCRAVCAGQGVRLLPRSAWGRGPGQRGTGWPCPQTTVPGCGLPPRHWAPVLTLALVLELGTAAVGQGWLQSADGRKVQTRVCVRPARPQWAAGLEHHEPRARRCDQHRSIAGCGVCLLRTRLEQGQCPWEAGGTGFAPTQQRREGPGPSAADQWPHLHPEPAPRPRAQAPRGSEKAEDASTAPFRVWEKHPLRDPRLRPANLRPVHQLLRVFKMKTWDLVLGASLAGAPRGAGLSFRLCVAQVVFTACV